MKVEYKLLAVIVPAILIISAVLFLALVPTDQEQDQPDDPTPVDPDPVSDRIPRGISYNKTTHTLSSRSEISWHVFDNLHAYSENGAVYEGYDVVSKSITLTPSKYTITAGEDKFTLTVSGKVSRTVNWDYIYNGVSYPVSVSYEIDIDDYVKITEKSQKFNENVPHKFAEMSDIVTVNDTIRGIEAQLEKIFIQIAGSTDDGHDYAEFLASMAQVPVKYPAFITYGDMQIWGVSEYWQDTMETLYHVAGDCEDKAALACALFIAAGYKAAMCGVAGHIAAGVAVDDFKERSEEELTAMGMHKWVFAASKDANGHDTETVYYAVETIKEEQHYIGYLEAGPASCIDTYLVYWGKSGFYPVN